MSGIRNGTWLDLQVFPEPAWVVPGVIPEGCCILSGHPKIASRSLCLPSPWRRPVVGLFSAWKWKIRGGRTQSAYSDDYKAGTLLQKLLAKGGTAIAVHHNRKGESEDFLDQVSGTLGLAGSVYTIITLNRQRTGASGTLSVTGRDVDEMAYKLNFVGGQWSTDGGDLAEAARRTTRPRFGAKMQEALELVASGMATTIGEVAEFLDVPDGTARKYLSRLASDYGLIERTGNGRYGPVTVSQVSQEAPSSEDLLTSAERVA
jgi:hypothetical protein